MFLLHEIDHHHHHRAIYSSWYYFICSKEAFIRERFIRMRTCIESSFRSNADVYRVSILIPFECERIVVLICTRRRNQGGTAGALNRRISEQKEWHETMAEPRGQNHRELTTNNEQRTTNKAIYYIIRITTGEPVSANALTPTHAHEKMHTQTAWWSLCRKHTTSAPT